METARQITYGLSVLAGILASIFPQYSTPLLMAATGLAGYATTHPSDSKATAAPKKE